MELILRYIFLYFALNTYSGFADNNLQNFRADRLKEMCITTEYKIGTCVSLRDCNKFATKINLTVKDINFINENKCGFFNELPLICCTSQFKKDDKNLLPKAPDCGYVEAVNFVIGGVEAKIIEQPWFAVLYYKNDVSKNLEFKCGGSLISKDYVLTAAHCLTGKEYTLTHVVLGDHNITNDGIDCQIINNQRYCNQPIIVEIAADGIFIHPHYIEFAHKNDIALIKLNSTVETSSFIRPICLPLYDRKPCLKSGLQPRLQIQYAVGFGSYCSNFEDVYKEKLVISGFGENSLGNISDVKMIGNVQAINLNECKNSYEEYGIDIDATQICTTTDDSDTCFGDSGGPITASFANDVHSVILPTHYLIGITSFGSVQCLNGNVPSVYTNVVAYMDWILDTLKS